MKKKMIRMLSVLLCAVLLIAALPAASVQAAEPERTLDYTARKYKSIYVDEEGIYYFETFADLKELTSQSDGSYMGALYIGEGPLVIEENLTLPGAFELLAPEIVIPAGVTLNAAYNWVSADSMTVNGDLEVGTLWIYVDLTVNGSIFCRGSIEMIDGPALSGKENIYFADDTCDFEWIYYAYDMSELKAALQDASRSTDVYVVFAEDFVIDQSVAVPENCMLCLWAVNGIRLAPGCTLENNGFLDVKGPVTIQGKLLNNTDAIIQITAPDEDYTRGKLSFENGGTYGGEGIVWIEKAELNHPGEVLWGLDLSPFQVTDGDYYWEMKMLPVTGLVAMYSVFNPDSLEHMFAMEGELAALEAAGWVTVGISFYSATEGIPVYRLFNPTNYSHYYCINEQERANLIAQGWLEDGLLCFTQEGGIPIYDLFNPNTYLHYYSAMRDEIDRLVSEGWIEVGLAWFAANP